MQGNQLTRCVRTRAIDLTVAIYQLPISSEHNRLADRIANASCFILPAIQQGLLQIKGIQSNSGFYFFVANCISTSRRFRAAAPHPSSGLVLTACFTSGLWHDHVGYPDHPHAVAVHPHASPALCGRGWVLFFSLLLGFVVRLLAGRPVLRHEFKVGRKKKLEQVLEYTDSK